MTHRSPPPLWLPWVLALLALGCAASGARHQDEAAPAARSETHGGEASGGVADDAASEAPAPQGVMRTHPPPAEQPGMAPQSTTRTTESTTGQADTMVGGARLEYTSLVSYGSELGAALDAGACDEARDLRDRICGLSERICEIADDHPGHEPTRARCEDGARRCETATDRVADQCG